MDLPENIPLLNIDYQTSQFTNCFLTLYLKNTDK